MIELIDFSEQKHLGKGQCRRIFHGRGYAYEGLEHVVIDWWPPVVLITLYKEVEREWLLTLADQLSDRMVASQSVMVQYRCRPKAPFELLVGEMFRDFIVDESGLKYHVELGRSQNIGLFLDMRLGRDWVREHAKGKKVLNLFAYSCAFSVAAIEGGALQVVNVDLSKPALTRGRENHRLNGHDMRKVTFQSVDIFKSFSRLKKFGPYDLLICDPPAFQKGSVDIKRDYPKILRRVSELMNPAGQLMLCLNSPDLTENFLHDLVAEYCPDYTFVKSIPAPEVFVESMPGRGLKVLLYAHQ